LLRMLTIAGAKALGITNELGTLSKGKRFQYAILPEDF
jgi:aminodeoxyfutalosine deaminase